MGIRPVLGAAALVAVLAGTLLVLVTQPFVAPIPSRPPQVDSARLEAHVKRLSVDLHPRSHDRFENLERAARYIADELRASGASVTVQEVPIQGKYTNVVARFGPPSGPLLVIGAHYDSHGDTPGADDNASGVAGLIELSRLLGSTPQSRPIELVAYTLEEPPHFRTDRMGSVRHARSLAAEKREVRLMLSLEMIGFFSDAPGSQGYPFPAMSHLYSDRGDFIALVGRFGDFNAARRAKAFMTGATDLPVHSINAPPLLQGIDFSDHASYWNEGFTAMMVTDTAFYRNRHYHRTSDTFETLDYRRMAKVVQSVYALSQGY